MTPKILVSLLLVAFVAACGNVGNTTDPQFGYAPPSYAGINQAYLDLNNDGVADMIVTGGKEQDTIKLKGSLPMPDGKLVPFEYTASGVKAFDGQKFRAEVEQIIAKAQSDTAIGVAPTVENIVNAIMNAATAAIAP